MIIRMRIDGLLREMVPPHRKMQAAVIARIKILSKMNIADRRLPQDGRFKVKSFGQGDRCPCFFDSDDIRRENCDENT